MADQPTKLQELEMLAALSPALREVIDQIAAQDAEVVARRDLLRAAEADYRDACRAQGRLYDRKWALLNQARKQAQKDQV